MLCPRREEVAPSSIFKLPDEDVWRKFEHAGGTCSYCGSMHPDEFMRAVEAGATLTPTDKDYKAYLEDSVRGMQKFYFQHLSDDQWAKLIELVNARAIKFARPGYFYVMPYRMKRVDPV